MDTTAGPTSEARIAELAEACVVYRRQRDGARLDAAKARSEAHRARASVVRIRAAVARFVLAASVTSTAGLVGSGVLCWTSGPTDGLFPPLLACAVVAILAVGGWLDVRRAASE